MDELKNCPFCGGKAELYIRKKTYSTKTIYIPRCADRFCCGRTTHVYESEEKAINSWNKRDGK